MHAPPELLTDPVYAGFFELERAASARPVDELARWRTAWLERRPSQELAGLGVPAILDDGDDHRTWSLPV